MQSDAHPSADVPHEPIDFVIDVFGICSCCDCLRATWKELLEHFHEHLPERGDAQALRVRVSALADELDRVVIRATAPGFGRVHDGDVLMIGLIFQSAANEH